MALNPNAAGKKEADCTRTGDQHRDGGEVQKESSAASAAANQNGDQAGCGDGVMPDREAPERRRSVQRDARSFNTSPLPGQKPNEDVPRRNFQIPRKTRERKGLYQILAPDSREFEDLVKLISSFYLDSSSRGMFSYCKARLIHNELLEKEFIEKRREMKQEGRTDQELTESYCFLYPDKSKLQWVCEKGLSVGHARITTVGNPSSGVYLSKYSDLLQMNPFEAGTTGDMIVFKVMRGRIKHIFDNMPKNAMEPTPKFDCHLSKSASRATSLLSYRAFELTQQYFFEFAFDEIKARPRHVCPYAVVSFQYKGKETAAAPMTAHRFNTISPEGNRGKNCYTVWSGPLVNKGQELFPVCLRSSKRAYLPFRLPEKLQVNRAMQLDQVKRKLPSILFSWDTYSMSREVLKYGMFCSLFDVVDGKGKPTCGSLAALINKLERDRMVLVKSLLDRGFLFLLSSAQMLDSKERWGRVEKNLQALFIFQESRMVVKYSSRLFDSDLLTVELRPSFLPCVESFIPALHYALFKLRPNPGKDPSFGVERQATDYLTRMDLGTVRPFILPDYKHVDDRTKPLPLHRPKCNMEAALRSYIHNPANYVLPLAKAKDIIYKIQNPVPAPAPAPMEYSPVSDWGGSDRGSDRAERLLERLPQEKSLLDRTGLERMRLDSSRQRSGLAPSVGTQLQPRTQIETQAQSQRLRLSQSEYDKEKMKQLLKLIHLHKKTLVKDPGKERAEDVGAWVSRQLKRKYEGDDTGGMSKHSRTDPLSNGEPSRVAQPDEPGDEPVHSENLTEVMESMGIYDTDLRSRTNTDASSVHETQRLLKILLTTLNKAMTQGSLQVNHGEPSAGAGRSDLAVHDPDFRKQSELHLQTNYLEDMDCSPGSPVSPGSPPQQPSTSDNLMWVVRTDEDKAQIFPELKVEPKLKPKLEPNLEPKPESNPELRFESKPEAKVELDPDAKFQSNLELKPEPKAESKLEMKYEPKVKPELDSEPFVELSQEPKPEPGFEPKLELESGALIVADHQPGQQNPTLMEVEKTTGPPTVPLIEEVPPGPSISLDTILNQEIHSLTSDIKSIMQSNHIYYSSRLPLRSPLHHSWLPNCSFSDFVVPFVSSVPIQGHVKALCEKMGKLIPAPPAPVEVTSPPPPVTSSNLTTPPPAPTPMSPPAHAATPPSAPTAAPHIKAESSQSNTTVSAESHKKMRTKARAQATSSEVAGNVYSPSQITPDSPGSNSAPSTGSGLLATSLIGQLKPEVFSSLVEIFKDVTKNTVKFYIYSGDEEESTVCREIKEYLISLGNRECSPQTFLENSGSLDKLLIIIQNEDIAAHVHKIPALVSLKKLPSVSFAGVDTLDDVKNRTYNELFVSGGFIVSDEHVLNPDFITQDRLQGLLKFLEEQSTPEQPWQWKVHCKSQKKLKELGRMNTNAMGLLNLLTAFQKKHLVEFLPYHECDTQSRQAPDLECLIKLQAQYTQQRHLIFLTERPFEMFLQYSRNGIVIASIDDVMSGFHSLIGSISQNELPTPPSTVVNEECVEQEDMSLDSDDDEPADVPELSEQNHGIKEKHSQPPPPEMEDFRPPLPDQHLTPESTPMLPDYSALKTVISQFKANQMGSSDIGSMSPGGFPVNPHQSFLCPSASWSSYTGSSSYAASPAYPASPCSGTQEQEHRPPVTASGTVSTPPTMTTHGPLANLASLPLEVKPPPPPHLMLMGRAYGSDSGAAGAVGAFAAGSVLPLPHPLVESSPISTSLPYTDQSDAAQKGYMAGIHKSASETPTHQPETPQGGPGESTWGATVARSCETASSRSEPISGPMDPSGLSKSGEQGTHRSGAPGNQGGRTQVNCTDNLGSSVGIPTAATRGSAIVRPKLPPHSMGVGGYGSIGGVLGHMDHGLTRGAVGPGSLGIFRGRGPPPVGMWPRPGRGHERGGGPCSWGYPGGRGAGQDYYLDYTYPYN